MFHFKQFSIEDEGATMKVGTDALLLGALVSTESEPHRILDIGTGCGILALIMAQRFANSKIDAIDIDTKTTTVADSNFKSSPWSDRIAAYNLSLEDFANQVTDRRYDIIISNPPYFTNSLRNNDPRKRLARHDDTMPLGHLMHISSKLLNSQATTSKSAAPVVAIIIPYTLCDNTIATACQNGLYLSSELHIANRPSDNPKLSVLQFTKITTEAIEPVIYHLRNNDKTYSEWYRNLAFPFLTHLS